MLEDGVFKYDIKTYRKIHWQIEDLANGVLDCSNMFGVPILFLFKWMYWPKGGADPMPPLNPPLPHHISNIIWYHIISLSYIIWYIISHTISYHGITFEYVIFMFSSMTINLLIHKSTVCNKLWSCGNCFIMVCFNNYRSRGVGSETAWFTESMT